MNLVSCDEVVSWLSMLDQLSRTGRCGSPGFLKPFHFVTLAHTVRKAGMQQIRLPESLEQYAARMHLWDAIGFPSPVSVREHESRGRFVPLMPLTSRNAVFDCAQQLAEVTVSANLGRDAIDSLATTVSELLDNCFAHSGLSEFFGLACAQYWKKGNLLQIAISDTGVGVRNNLLRADTEEVQAQAANMNCCELATQLHASSKLRDGHAGYGLALARQLVEQNSGALLLASGNEYFSVVGGRCSSGSLRSPWQGTLIIAEFKASDRLDIGAIYKSWPPPRGYEDDDYNF